MQQHPWLIMKMSLQDGQFQIILISQKLMVKVRPIQKPCHPSSAFWRRPAVSGDRLTLSSPGFHSNLDQRWDFCRQDNTSRRSNL